MPNSFGVRLAVHRASLGETESVMGLRERFRAVRDAVGVECLNEIGNDVGRNVFIYFSET